MAVVPLMTWNEQTARWFKKYKKHQYAVSCKSLGAPTTREGSVRAANRWWLLKRMEIDNKRLAVRPYQVDWEQIVKLLRDKAEWLSKHRIGPFLQEHGEGLYKRMAAMVARMPKDVRAHFAARAEIRIEKLRQATSNLLDTHAEERLLLLDLADLMQQQIDSGSKLPNPERLIKRFPDVFDLDDEWRKRLIYTTREAPSHANTVAAHVDRWLKMQAARAQVGQICRDRYTAYYNAITAFQDRLGVNKRLEDITGESLEAYKTYLLQQVAERTKDPSGIAGITQAYADDQMRVAVQFANWLCRQDLIPRLTILNDPMALRIKPIRPKKKHGTDTP